MLAVDPVFRAVDIFAELGIENIGRNKLVPWFLRISGAHDKHRDVLPGRIRVCDDQKEIVVFVDSLQVFADLFEALHSLKGSAAVAVFGRHIDVEAERPFERDVVFKLRRVFNEITVREDKHRPARTQPAQRFRIMFFEVETDFFQLRDLVFATRENRIEVERKQLFPAF